MRTRSERSAGGVVFRRADGAVDIALAARRTRRGELAWGLPKGLIEPDEEPEEAALREVREETGLEAEIDRDLGSISYFYRWEDEGVRKSVRFFLMRATGGDTSEHDHEMEEVRWFPLSEALRKATYRSEGDVLRRAVAILEEE
ncbi:MAG: NUDIX hydrolase [Actinomycetota bacterium]